MTLERTEAFLAWLDKQLAENHLTDTQLANKAGISHSVISKARKGILPKWDACVAIANALRVDEVEVFRAAGLLPLPPEMDADLERLRSACDQVPKNQRKRAYRVLRAISVED